MLKKVVSRAIRLRGYIEQVGEEDFFGICLTVNVCTRGKSLAETEQNLLEAVGLYLESAAKENAIPKWVPRRAPLYHRLRYISIWLRLVFSPPSYDAQLMSRVVYA